MHVIDRGPTNTDEPPLAIIGAIHGDEPCGVRAMEHAFHAWPRFERPVKFIIANERAYAEEERCIDTDLNRAFPGDAAAEAHETCLAARLLDELAGCEVLALHSETNNTKPFALVQHVTERTKSLVAATGLTTAVDISYVEGGLEWFVPGVAVECGTKGTVEAIENARSIVDTFLAAKGAVERDSKCALSDPEFFCIVDETGGPDHEFVAENFELVQEGEIFARPANTTEALPDHSSCEAESDSSVLRADAPFVPVLMSTDGYEDMLGFQADPLGCLSDVDAPDRVEYPTTDDIDGT